MSHQNEMKHCPDCQAPNPATRTTCYACGQSLSVRPTPAGSPGERTYPCLTCQTEIPYSATICPGCGRVIASSLPAADTPLILDDPAAVRALSAMELQMAAAPPPGWKVEPLPDGTVRLRRRGWLRLRQDAGTVIAAVVFLGLICAHPLLELLSITELNPKRLHPASSLLDLLLVVASGILLLLCLAYFVWSVFGREEVRAGQDLLEVRRELGPLRFRRCLRAGSLRLLTSDYSVGRGTREIGRRLVAYGASGESILLEMRSRSAVWDDMAPDAGPVALGRYLAAITGWPFVDAEHNGLWS